MMTQTIYGLTRDNGDGSSSICWFTDIVVVNRILDGDDDDFLEEFTTNDGISEILTFPDDLDLKACGFSFNDNIYENQ